MKYQSRYRTIVFDLDGTLVDSAPDIMRSLNAVLKSADRAALSRSDVIGMIGDGIPSLVEKGFLATGKLPPSETLAEYTQACLKIYSDSPCEDSMLYDGVVRELEAFHVAGIAMAVCTNKTESIARQVLQLLKIDHFFGAVVGGDTLPVKKPHPQHLLHTIELIDSKSGSNGDRSETLMVGDSYNDVLVGNNAQTPVAFMTYGYNNTSIDSLEVVQKFDSFEKLSAFILDRE